MKEKFEWYISPSENELDFIWSKGILTVDANVLLDLYRYHEDTRNSLIQSIKQFEGSKWISYQAATEFFRNRTKVIISSEKAFKEAHDEADKFSASLASIVSKLKGNRIIPSSISIEIEQSVSPIIEKSKDDIERAKENYPNFLQQDPILDELLNIFDNAIGNDFSEEDKDNIKSQAEIRKQGKIPPGYLDDDKDADRPYGDYYLWQQIIQHAKDRNCPVLIVTSERKEDWWEKISGKTTGPRPELLKEAKELSGQRIMIYQTERFLKHSMERLKQPINEKAIEEIRAVGTLRTEHEAAVKLIEHVTYESSEMGSKGYIHLELKRPLRNFTVSGRMDPNVQSIPMLNASLMHAPDALPLHKISARTGTTYDFNIHLVCSEQGSTLPAGPYIFQYEAKCGEPQDNPEIDITPENAE